MADSRECADGQEELSEAYCFICLDTARKGEPLERVCKCPTTVHKKCIAKWQLFSAGKREERVCRFCSTEYPSWKDVLSTPNLRQVSPVLTVNYNGVHHRVKVRPGREGHEAFLSQLRQLLGCSLETVSLVFRCHAPDTGAEMYLHGIEAFEAAMHCACVQASKRAAEQAALERVARRFKPWKSTQQATPALRPHAGGASGGRQAGGLRALPGRVRVVSRYQQQQQLQQQARLLAPLLQPAIQQAAAGPAAASPAPAAPAASGSAGEQLQQQARQRKPRALCTMSCPPVFHLNEAAPRRQVSEQITSQALPEASASAHPGPAAPPEGEVCEKASSTDNNQPAAADAPPMHPMDADVPLASTSSFRQQACNGPNLLDSAPVIDPSPGSASSSAAVSYSAESDYCSACSGSASQRDLSSAPNSGTYPSTSGAPAPGAASSSVNSMPTAAGNGAAAARAASAPAIAASQKKKGLIGSRLARSDAAGGSFGKLLGSLSKMLHSPFDRRV